MNVKAFGIFLLVVGLVPIIIGYIKSDGYSGYGYGGGIGLIPILGGLVMLLGFGLVICAKSEPLAPPVGDDYVPVDSESGASGEKLGK